MLSHDIVYNKCEKSLLRSWEIDKKKRTQTNIHSHSEFRYKWFLLKNFGRHNARPTSPKWLWASTLTISNFFPVCWTTTVFKELEASLTYSFSMAGFSFVNAMRKLNRENSNKKRWWWKKKKARMSNREMEIERKNGKEEGSFWGLCENRTH